MKAVICALLLLLFVSQSDALRCRCGGKRHCPNPVETCVGPDSVCASVIFHVGSRPGYFKGCLQARQCSQMNQPGISTATCCRTNECNR